MRHEPILLSDYSARPFVLNLCEPVAGKRVLDLGCGEGYCTRQLKERGATEIIGIDIASAMVEAAIWAEEAAPLGIQYKTADVLTMDTETEGNFDLVLAMFLFNYLTVEDIRKAMRKVFDRLNLGGKFVFAVHHPFYPFQRAGKFPFYFTPKGGYFTGRNKTFPGKIWRRDGVSVDVLCVHKTVHDYMDALQQAGFRAMPAIHELKINESHVKLDPYFFEPLLDYPLHMSFSVVKE